MSTQDDSKDFLHKLTAIINANLTTEQFGVNELARKMGMSRSNLHRKVESYSGKSISTFISDVKLDRAKSLLQGTSHSISEIAYECGFHSTTYFSKCFKDRYGYPPGEARNRETWEIGTGDLQSGNAGRGFWQSKISLPLTLLVTIILLAAVLLVMIRPFSARNAHIERTIAVLPFENMSTNEEDTYLGNAFTEDIIMALQKIKAFDRVLSFSSTMQYKENRPTIPEIAQRLEVNYLIEGSIQKAEGRVRVRVQLIRAKKEDHIWGETFDEVYTKPEDMFMLQSSIAQSVADRLNAIITPQEKELIEKIPTESQTAWEFFLQGRELSYVGADKESLLDAQKLYRYSLKYDPEFSYPYVWIGFTYFFLYLQNRVDNAGYRDSINYYAEKTLSLDHQNTGAYFLKGTYYGAKGDLEAAIEQYDKATDINPNYSDPYEGRGWAYFRLGDYPNSIKNYSRITQLDRSDIYPNTLRIIGSMYAVAGFPEKAIEIINEAFSLDQDTIVHYYRLAQLYYISGNARTAIEYALKAFDLDSTNTSTLNQLGQSYAKLRKYDSAQFYFDRYLKWMEEKDRVEPWSLHTVAYTYQKNGELEKARYYTKRLYEYYKNTEDHYFLAYYFMLMGDTDKVYDHLSELAKSKKYSIYETQVRNDPVFDEISSEPEFLSIVDQIEARYRTEHEKTRQRLEENDL